MNRIGLTLSALLVVVAPSATFGQEDVGAARAQPDAAATAESGFFAETQIFGDWAFRFTDDDSFNSFQLRRAELAAGWRAEYGAAYINFEAIRSAGPDSFAGIDGNSLVPRVKHAFGLIDPELGPGRVVVQGGMIADPWIRSVETGYSMRGAAPLVSEQGLFFDTSDLGLVVGYDCADGFAELHWSLTNGEGRNEVEQNSGKNSTIVATVRPVSFAVYGDSARLGIHGTYRDGSIGVASARNHRFAGALTLDHDWFGAGFEYVRALGYLGRSAREAQGIGAWAHGHVLRPWLGLHARFTQTNTDLERDDASVQTIDAGLFGDLAQPSDPLRIRWFLTFQNASYGTAAGPVPGVPTAAETNSVMLTLEVNAGRGFLQDFNGDAR